MNTTTKTEPTRNPERESTRERILGVAAWLTSGLLRPEAVAGAMREWKVSRRTAQVYVQKAANRIARLTEYDDPLFAMKLSQLQRDKIFQQLQTLQHDTQIDPPEARMLLQSFLAQLKVLDSRDRTAAKIAQLEAKLGRTETRRRAGQAVAAEDQTKVVAERPLADDPPVPPAHAETMRAAAQVTPPPDVPKQRKSQLGKKMQTAEGSLPAAAPDGENCALEMSAVAEGACVASAAA